MQQPDISQLMALLQTKEGQQLLTYLKTNGGSAARSAAAMAASGDMNGAKDAIHPLLKDPQLKALLEKLGGTP